MIRALEIHPCGCAQVCPVGPGARPAEAAAGCATEHLVELHQGSLFARLVLGRRLGLWYQGFDVLIGVRLLVLVAG